jgi:uncharacterized RDD family membrane protein YckC
MTESGTPGDPGTPPASGWQAAPSADPAATVAGAPGFVYADLPNRVIALFIDALVIGAINIILAAIVSGILGFGILFFLIYAVGTLAISAAYLIYTWTSMRATLGMKVLGMQIGNAVDGKTVTTEQAMRRWLALFVPGILSQIVFYTVGGILASFVGLAAFAWIIYLLYTTSQSPTKQGWHDVFANTMVVKAARSAG